MASFEASEPFDKVVPAFVAALNAMDDIPRTATAEMDKYSYSYAPLNVVLDAIRPHLKENDLALTQVPTMDGVATVLWHTSGQYIEFPPLLIRPAGSTPQGVGSAISFARRYALLSILGLATEDDDGRAGSVDTGAATAEENPRAGRVDDVLRRLTELSDKQKLEMKSFAEREDRRLSGKALFEDAEWLNQVEAYLEIIESDAPEEPADDTVGAD